MDINSNSSTDQQLQEFIKYFDRMQQQASPEDYKHMLEDVRDTCQFRLDALKKGTSDTSWFDFVKYFFSKRK